MSSQAKHGWIALVIGMLQVIPAPAQSLPAAFTKPVPDSLRDLQDIEAHVKKVVDKVLPCTVNLRIGQVQGSGVIVSRDGYVLTAGHVSGEANRDVVIVLPDGRKLNGKTLGANNGIDSGMVRITDRVEFPFLDMAASAGGKGQWCLALGHPGGFKPGRAPVVRLGRVVEVNKGFLLSSCGIISGDSGGPLFDMHGKVIGIHSRINEKHNVHVPIDTYHDTWPRLASAEVWGTKPAANTESASAYLGVRPDPDRMNLTIQSVTPGSPAQLAGLLANDVILKMDNQPLGTTEDLSQFLKGRPPGARVVVQVRRGGETVTVTVVLGSR